MWRGESGVDVERLLARLGMHPHHGMLGEQRPPVAPGAGSPRWRSRRPAVRSGAPHAARRRAGAAAPTALVGGDGVGPLGVSAVGRDHLGAQDRRGRRIDRRGHVGVPVRLVEAAAAAVAGLEPVAEDRVDRRVVRIGDRIEQRMRGRRRPERRREPQMVVVVDELVAEEHHLPLQQRRADLGDLLVASAARSGRRR